MALNLTRLRAERIARGLSQEEMAIKMGWKNRTLYAKRENGLVNIGANELIKMVEILGYSSDEDHTVAYDEEYTITPEQKQVEEDEFEIVGYYVSQN